MIDPGESIPNEDDNDRKQSPLRRSAPPPPGDAATSNDVVAAAAAAAAAPPPAGPAPGSPPPQEEEQTMTEKKGDISPERNEGEREYPQGQPWRTYSGGGRIVRGAPEDRRRSRGPTTTSRKRERGGRGVVEETTARPKKPFRPARPSPFEGKEKSGEQEQEEGGGHEDDEERTSHAGGASPRRGGRHDQELLDGPLRTPAASVVVASSSLSSSSGGKKKNKKRTKPHKKESGVLHDEHQQEQLSWPPHGVTRDVDDLPPPGRGDEREDRAGGRGGLLTAPAPDSGTGLSVGNPLLPLSSYGGDGLLDSNRTTSRTMVQKCKDEAEHDSSTAAAAADARRTTGRGAAPGHAADPARGLLGNDDPASMIRNASRYDSNAALLLERAYNRYCNNSSPPPPPRLLLQQQEQEQRGQQEAPAAAGRDAATTAAVLPPPVEARRAGAAGGVVVASSQQRQSDNNSNYHVLLQLNDHGDQQSAAAVATAIAALVGPPRRRVGGRVAPDYFDFPYSSRSSSPAAAALRQEQQQQQFLLPGVATMSGESRVGLSDNLLFSQQQANLLSALSAFRPSAGRGGVFPLSQQQQEGPHARPAAATSSAAGDSYSSSVLGNSMFLPSGGAMAAAQLLLQQQQAEQQINERTRRTASLAALSNNPMLQLLAMQQQQMREREQGVTAAAAAARQAQQQVQHAAGAAATFLGGAASASSSFWSNQQGGRGGRAERPDTPNSQQRHDSRSTTPRPTAPSTAGMVSSLGASANPSWLLSHGAISASGGEQSLTGRPAVTLYMSACDNDNLSEYQCLVRQQIEVFEATTRDIESTAQGRNKPIVLGQVGVRCKHCAHLAPSKRARGAIYYPAKLQGLYQAAQNMATTHLCQRCDHVPPGIKQRLVELKEKKSMAGGGKKYWADGLRILGVYEDADGLRFTRTVGGGPPAHSSNQEDMAFPLGRGGGVGDSQV